MAVPRETGDGKIGESIVQIQDMRCGYCSTYVPLREMVVLSCDQEEECVAD